MLLPAMYENAYFSTASLTNYVIKLFNLLIWNLRNSIFFWLYMKVSIFLFGGVTMVFFIYKDEFIATYAAIVYKYSYVKLKKNYLNLSE